MVLEGFFNVLFGWTLVFGNLGSILIMSVILTLIITLIYKYTTDQILLKDLKGQVKSYQNQIKTLRANGETDKIMEVNKKAMKLNMQYMKHSMKPMLYTFIPIILIFGWLKSIYPSGTIILPFPFKIPLFGLGFGWLGTYIVASIIFSIVIRKFMKVY